LRGVGVLSGGVFGLGGPSDPEAARAHLAQLQARVDRMAEQTQAVAERLGQVRVSVSDPNGIVDVTVDSAGELVGVRFTSRVGRVPPEAVSRAVLSALAEAKRKVADQVQTAIAETMGADSQAGRAMADRVGAGLREAADRLGSENAGDASGERR
jgi:DNA-binding protein YbaB